MGYADGCRCSPYFFFGWFRHTVLHHLENNICWSDDCIQEQRICPLFLAHLDMQVTIINKILLLIILDSVMLTWINQCQIEHRTLVSPLLLINFPQLSYFSVAPFLCLRNVQQLCFTVIYSRRYISSSCCNLYFAFLIGVLHGTRVASLLETYLSCCLVTNRLYSLHFNS